MNWVGVFSFNCGPEQSSSNTNTKELSLPAYVCLRAKHWQCVHELRTRVNWFFSHGNVQTPPHLCFHDYHFLSVSTVWVSLTQTWISLCLLEEVKTNEEGKGKTPKSQHCSSARNKNTRRTQLADTLPITYQSKALFLAQPPTKINVLFEALRISCT